MGHAKNWHAGGAHPSLLGFYGHYGPGSKHVRADGPLPLAQGLGNSHCLVMELARGGEIFEDVMREFGLEWAPQKQRGPCACIEFLGLLVCNDKRKKK